MANLDDVLAKARQAKTVVDSVRASNADLKALLEEAKGRDDNVKIDEAIAILDSISSDPAVITENTAAADEDGG